MPSAAASAPAPSVVGFTTSTGHFPCWTAYVGTVPTVHVLNPPTRFERPSTRRLTSEKIDESISNVRREVRRLLEAKQLRRAARIRVRGHERANGLLARGEIRRHVRVAQMSSSRFLDVVAVKVDDAIGRAKQPPRRPLRDGMRRVRAAQRETHHALELFFVPEFLARGDLVFGRRRQRGPVHATRRGGGGEHAAGHGTEHDAFEKLLAATPDAHEVGSWD